MTRHRVVCLTFLLLAVPAALLAQGRVRQSVSAASYFPLPPGSWWVYERAGAGEAEKWRVEVDDASHGNMPRKYASLRGYFSPVARQVAVGGLGVVMERAPGSGPDLLWYMLGARPNVSWTVRLAATPEAAPGADCVDGSLAWVARRDEVVRVPAGEFHGVIRVDFRSPCADAGLVSEWFAPGVGLVRREETSIAGPVVSELLEAKVGDTAVPRPAYSTGMVLERPVLVHNLMPPVVPEAFATLRGELAVRNPTGVPLELRFSGCASALIEVRDERGEVVVSRRIDDGGCCDCENLLVVDVGRRPLALRFALRLATEGGEPLPDGRYSVSGTFETADPEILRPAARALVEVTSVH